MSEILKWVNLGNKTTKKETIKQGVERRLKAGWYSNFQICMALKSASADRELRRLRENPPKDYVMIQRPKKVEGYNNCLEYRLVRVEDAQND